MSQKIQEELETALDWQDAACKIIDIFTSEGRPFSSGEVAKELRTYRSDFVFSHYGLGNFIKDLYWNQSIRFKDAVGNPIFAYQVPRLTTGKGRTPAGVEVFVYAPTEATGKSHDFEIDIPTPIISGLNQSPQNNTPFSGYKNSYSSNKSNFATVQGDRRIRIPRSVFESWSHLSGVSLQAGSCVYITSDDNKAEVYFVPQNNTVKFSLTKDKGAVKFLASNYLTPGETFAVSLEKDRLVIDFEK